MVQEKGIHSRQEQGSEGNRNEEYVPAQAGQG